MLKRKKIIGVAGSLALLALSLPGQKTATRESRLGRQTSVEHLQEPRRFLFARPRVVIDDRYFSSAGVLVDMDMDGFKDVLFGGIFFLEKGGIFSYMTLNEQLQRKGTYRFQSPSNNPTHVFPYILAADLNEDGMPDAIGIGRRGGIAVHLRAFVPKQKGSIHRVMGFQSRYFEPREMDPGAVGGVGFDVRFLRALDLDNDGHQDLLVAGDFMALEGRVNSSGLLLLRGDGKGKFARPKSLLSGPVRHVEITDLDGDGRSELIVLGDKGRVTKLTPRPLGGYLQEKWLLTAISNAETLLIRDVDQDGQKDFVIFANQEFEDSIGYAVYEGLVDGRPGQAWTGFLHLGQGAGQVRSWLLEDLDADGYPDVGLLVADETGRMSLRILAGGRRGPWKKEKRIALPARLAVDFDLDGLGSLRFEDMDGDGARDLWITPVRAQKVGPLGILHLKNRRKMLPSVQRLGTSTRTGQSVLPRISVGGGLPRIGNKKFMLRLADVPGSGAPYWLWISHVRMDVPIMGMRVRVFPFKTILATSQGSGARGGLVRVPFRIPKVRSLVGESLFVQWVFPSKGAKNPLSLARSEALELRILPASRTAGR